MPICWFDGIKHVTTENNETSEVIRKWNFSGLVPRPDPLSISSRFQADRVSYGELFDDADAVPLDRVGGASTKRENQIIAQIQHGDTLQAICLRYNCSVSTTVEGDLGYRRLLTILLLSFAAGRAEADKQN